VFSSKKNTADAHEEMNENYFKEQLLQNVPRNSVIVVSNASITVGKKKKLNKAMAERQN
jgi:hypothetical protein